MINEMKPYGNYNGNSGIVGYAIDEYDTCMDIEYASVVPIRTSGVTSAKPIFQ